MSNTNYRPDIDGLRAIAVIAVVINHLYPTLIPGGFIGVDIFFVISGYLITSIIDREIREKKFTFHEFYARRARRIFPALFSMLTVVSFASYFLFLPSDLLATLRAGVGSLFFSSNVVLWRDLKLGYFAATDAGLNPLLHTWSLSVEEQFYVFFPVLLILCHKYCKGQIRLILLGISIFSLASAHFFLESKSVAVFFLTPFRAWELLAGSLLAYTSARYAAPRLIREPLALAGVAAVLYACFSYSEYTSFPGLAALLPVLGTAALIYAGGGGGTVPGAVLQWFPITYIGRISYSLYLWHWPLIVFYKYITGSEIQLSQVPFLLTGSLVLGALSYHFIEQPFRKGSRISTPRNLALGTASFASLFMVFSIVGLVTQGYSGRANAAALQFDRARAPEIPYVQCAGHRLKELCFLGDSQGPSRTLLWGDSHMLAWGPAFQNLFAKQHERAVFAPLYSCPPLLGVAHKNNASCAAGNRAIQAYLLQHPEIETVVLAALWKSYFRDDSHLVEETVNSGRQGTAAAQHALTETVNWLQAQGRKVVIIGPVPVHDTSVPFSLALEEFFGRKWASSSFSTDQQQLNAGYFSAIHELDGRAGVRVLNPVEWLCHQECQLLAGTESLYRDAHHLSVAGALSLESKLQEAF